MHPGTINSITQLSTLGKSRVETLSAWTQISPPYFSSHLVCETPIYSLFIWQWHIWPKKCLWKFKFQMCFVFIIGKGRFTFFCPILSTYTDKYLSEALLYAKHGGEHVVYKNCSECQKQFLYTTFSPQIWAWNFHVLNL